MRRMVLGTALLGVLVFMMVGQSQAAVVVFQDSFDGENGGEGIFNYNGFANWTVSTGTVDLLGNDFWDYQPGPGLYVELDGSGSLLAPPNPAAGALRLKNAITLAPGHYRLSYDLAGNHRQETYEAATIIVEVVSGSIISTSTISLTKLEPFQTFWTEFSLETSQNVSFSFAGYRGDDVGMLLDNILLTDETPIPPPPPPTPPAPVPEPASLAIWACGGLGALVLRRRRR